MTIKSKSYAEFVTIVVEVDEVFDTHGKSKMPLVHVTKIACTFMRTDRSHRFELKATERGFRVKSDGTESAVPYSKTYFLADEKPDYVDKAAFEASYQLNSMTQQSAFWTWMQ